MYLNIGNQTLLPLGEILGIFDLDNASWSCRTRQTLTLAEQAGQVRDAGQGELPNAFVLCQRGQEQTIYLSPLTAATLRKRVSDSRLSKKEHRRKTDVRTH